jgi:DNA polymerase III epsilon subunit-like protein
MGPRVFLKLQTTGQPGDQIIEIGATVRIGQEIKIFQRYIKPQVQISPSTTRLHGLSLVRIFILSKQFSQ